MSYKIKADVNTAKNVVVQNKNTGVSISTKDGNIYDTDSTGRIVVPLSSKDDTNNAVREFPLSQYGELYENITLGITYNAGFVLNFTRAIPLFLGGIIGTVPAQTLDLNVNNDAANQVIKIYVKLEQGLPSYHFNINEEGETPTNMFIGKVYTSATDITSVNIDKVSRFSIYRSSTTKIGAAFPVSTGHPTQTGTINW